MMIHWQSDMRHMVFFALNSARFLGSMAGSSLPTPSSAGLNQDGQLGNGNRDSSNVPVQAAPGLAFASLSAGDAHVCGIDTTGSKTHCWGELRQHNGLLSRSKLWVF